MLIYYEQGSKSLYFFINKSNLNLTNEANLLGDDCCPSVDDEGVVLEVGVGSGVGEGVGDGVG